MGDVMKNIDDLLKKLSPSEDEMVDEVVNDTATEVSWEVINQDGKGREKLPELIRIFKKTADTYEKQGMKKLAKAFRIQIQKLTKMAGID